MTAAPSHPSSGTVDGIALADKIVAALRSSPTPQIAGGVREPLSAERDKTKAMADRMARTLEQFAGLMGTVELTFSAMDMKVIEAACLAALSPQGQAGVLTDAQLQNAAHAAPQSTTAASNAFAEILKHVRAPNRPASERLDRIEEICVRGGRQ